MCQNTTAFYAPERDATYSAPTASPHGQRQTRSGGGLLGWCMEAVFGPATPTPPQSRTAHKSAGEIDLRARAVRVCNRNPALVAAYLAKHRQLAREVCSDA